MSTYEAVIGLEIHAELCTKTKIYCSCPNEFGGEPNTRICPVCMGLPGALPVLNKQVVQFAVKAGLAMNCHINNASRHDRKNYFYPDLPKAYQITQSERPICEKGFVDYLTGDDIKRVCINRIHIEEDAGKLMHDDESSFSLADLNRCGVPLIEIVTEPDLRSSREAKDFLETVKLILKYTGVSDCRMQEGSVRCDVNVSLREKGCTEYGTRVEMKNVNSFSGAMRAIDYEIKRQTDILCSGGIIEQETRRWDDAKGRSFVMRTKENAQDYRYFHEPDLPDTYINDEEISHIGRSIPELPTAKILRYMNDFGFSRTDAALIAEDTDRAELFDECVSLGKCRPKSICNRLLSDIARMQNESGLSIGEMHIGCEELCSLEEAVENGSISGTAGKKVLEEMLKTGRHPSDIIVEKGFMQISDKDVIMDIAKAVFDENPKSVDDYRNGKKNAMSFLIGKCMQKSKGRANPAVVNEIVSGLLNK